MSRDTYSDGHYLPFESNLIGHAMRELELCGQTQEDPAYAQSLICAVAAIASYGHSGGSAGVMIHQLTRLLNFEALSELTDDPDEWVDQTEASGRPLWQNKRQSSAFSDDGGVTYWTLEYPTMLRSAKESGKR